MNDYFYTAERNVQIVIYLLKAHGIKRVIASPGTTNMTFVASIQQDKWFEIYSSVDERSAAYIACGMAAETGEPVVLSCTGATASRNYMPGLTEAFYRKLPVLAITSHYGTQRIGHLLDQQIDRRQLPNDIAVESVTIPTVKTQKDERFCEIETNRALLALKLNGGGPVHINLFTDGVQDFSVKELAPAHVIYRYTYGDDLPNLPKVKRIAIHVGSHANFTMEETNAIEKFCKSNNAVVFCDHTGGYIGQYAITPHLIFSQTRYFSPIRDVDLMIQIGEISGTYHAIPKEVWRVSEDGALRDTYGKLTKVFMMREKDFFSYYSSRDFVPSVYLDECKYEADKMLDQIPELPFGNIWIAQHTIEHLPHNAELHMGIYNSLRSWNFFKLPEGVLGKSNVGGFGIDGGLSTLIGASLINKNKIFFGVFGDLAFFYDMNALGNRHIGKNLRIMLINNSRGSEFRLYCHPIAKFGDNADPYMAASGHYGNQSPVLVKGIAEALGFEYLTANDKDSYLANLDAFVSPQNKEHPIIFEVFTKTSDESDALEILQTMYVDEKREKLQYAAKIARKIIGEKGVSSIKKLLGE